jgi:hypothetical protein
MQCTRTFAYDLSARYRWIALSAPLASPKMLDFFRRAGRTTIQVCLVLVMLSVLIRNFWCRYYAPTER